MESKTIINKLYDIDEYLFKLIIFNNEIRGGLYDIPNKEKNIYYSIDDIIRLKLYPRIFSKGYERLKELYNFIRYHLEELKRNNETYDYYTILIFIISVTNFIIVNQVFGDGNHRTGYYFLYYILGEQIKKIYDKNNYEFDKKFFYEMNIFYDNIDYLHLMEGTSWEFQNKKFNFSDYKKYGEDKFYYFEEISEMLFVVLKDYLVF